MVPEKEEFFKIFDTGLSFNEWLDTTEESIKEKTKRYYEKIYMMVVSEYKSRITISSEFKINILAVIQDNCWDCQFYLPVLARLAENEPNINLKIFRKDNPIIESLLEPVNGGMKTPYVLFYSIDGYYIDRWVERPTIVYELYAKIKRELGFDNQEFYKEYRKAFLKDQEIFYRAAAEELALKICRANAIQGTSKRINSNLITT